MNHLPAPSLSHVVRSDNDISGSLATHASRVQGSPMREERAHAHAQACLCESGTREPRRCLSANTANPRELRAFRQSSAHDMPLRGGAAKQPGGVVAARRGKPSGSQVAAGLHLVTWLTGSRGCDTARRPYTAASPSPPAPGSPKDEGGTSFAGFAKFADRNFSLRGQKRTPSVGSQFPGFQQRLNHGHSCP